MTSVAQIQQQQQQQQQAGGQGEPTSSGGVRYTLVEAEPETPQQDKWKRKGSIGSNHSSGGGDGERGEGFRSSAFGRGRGGGRRGGRGGGFRGRGTFVGGTSYYGVPPAETRRMVADYAVRQIEFYFSVHNLCGDVFMRSYMDEEGYIPIAFVCNFPGVASLGADYGDILQGLRHSQTLEIDENNETMRLREGWQVWLLPNATGGRGVPRYIKVADAAPTMVQPQDTGMAPAEGTAYPSQSHTPAVAPGYEEAQAQCAHHQPQPQAQQQQQEATG